jgi:SAM-dependent methyltransferase
MKACSLCGGHESRTIRRNRWQTLDLKIVQCSVCGLLQVDPIPESEILNSFYGEDYFHSDSPLQGGYENYSADESFIRKTFLRRLREANITSKQVASAAALDLGCATGVFLDVLSAAGWYAQGLELSPAAAQKAKDKGFDVFLGDWQKASYPDQTFGLISLWDVIEHFPDPLKALRLCHQWLVPGGVLLLSTPDASAALARLLGPFWLGFRSAGEHVLFFSRQTITHALEEAGFDVVRIQSVGKFMRLDRIITRLSYYTRLFRVLLPFKGRFLSRISLYISSGDTMYVIARKR